jgi:hypothetical protein
VITNWTSSRELIIEKTKIIFESFKEICILGIYVKDICEVSKKYFLKNICFLDKALAPY